MTDPRSDPQPSGDERTMLTEFLDWYRLTIEVKVDGLDESQARSRIEPSDMTLLGIVRHVTEVERSWFRSRFRGEEAPYLYCTDEDPDADFHPGLDDTLADAVARYREECERAREITNAAASLDELSAVGVRGYDGRHVSLRWILVHMIEETARHAGHCDLLRQTIDGATGD